MAQEGQKKTSKGAKRFTFFYVLSLLICQRDVQLFYYCNGSMLLANQ